VERQAHPPASLSPLTTRARCTLARVVRRRCHQHLWRPTRWCARASGASRSFTRTSAARSANSKAALPSSGKARSNPALDAWLEKYALYNQPQRSVSYYTKGQVLGILLDIIIRDNATDNQKSLDDVLRTMKPGLRQGREVLSRQSGHTAGPAEKVTGTSLEDFFAKYVSGAEPLPYIELLARAGLELHQREIIHAVTGLTAERDPNGPWTVRAVDADGPAAKSGLLVGDEIVRWNNGEAPRRPEHWLSQQKPGDTLHLRVRRDDKDQNIDIRLGEQREKFYQVAESANCRRSRAAHSRGILRGGTDPVTARNR